MATEEGSAGLKRKHVQDLSVAPSSEGVPHTPHPAKEPMNQTPEIRQYAPVQNSKRPGKLRAILVMPREIRLEIFAHLSPLDLLNVSRTNGQIRVFVNGSSALWKTVMNSYHIPPPPCPEGHSIAQWAAFLFDECCQLCLLHGKRFLLHKSAYVRLCVPCADKTLDGKLRSTLELGNLKSQDFSLDDPSYLCNVEHVYGRSVLKDLFRPQLAKLSKKIASLGGDEKKRRDFFEEALAFRDERYRVAETVEKWHKALKDQKLAIAAATRRRRAEMIVANLEAEGYEVCMKIRFRVSRTRGFGLTKSLTDKEWTKIGSRFIHAVKDEHQRELTRLYPGLKGHFCLLRRQLGLIAEKGDAVTGEPLPTILTVAKSPAFRFLWDTHVDKKITAEEITLRLEESLEAVSKQWKAAVDKKLRSLLPLYITDTEGNGLDLLERATTWFKCLDCSEDAIHPSQILHHSCLLAREDSAVGNSGNEGGTSGKEGESVKDRDPFEGLEADILAAGRQIPTAEVVWTALISRSGPEQNMAFDDDSYRCSAAIIKAWDEDPLTVTYAWMSKASHRPECAQPDCARPFKCLFKCTEWYRAVLRGAERQAPQPIVCPKCCRPVTGKGDESYMKDGRHYCY